MSDSAQMLENVVDRMEGRTSEPKKGVPVSADSFALLEQVVESCRADESRSLLTEHGATLIPLLREIDRLTNRLANQIAMEIERPE